MGLSDSLRDFQKNWPESSSILPIPSLVLKTTGFAADEYGAIFRAE